MINHEHVSTVGVLNTTALHTTSDLLDSATAAVISQSTTKEETMLSLSKNITLICKFVVRSPKYTLL